MCRSPFNKILYFRAVNFSKLNGYSRILVGILALHDSIITLGLFQKGESEEGHESNNNGRIQIEFRETGESRIVRIHAWIKFIHV